MGRVDLPLEHRIRRFWLQSIAYDDLGRHFDGTFTASRMNLVRIVERHA